MEIKVNFRQLVGVALLTLAGLQGFGGGLPWGFDHLPVPPWGQQIELSDAWLIVIEESSERPAWLAALVADQGLKEQLADAKAKWMLLDKDSADAAPYVSRAGSLPGYVLVNGDGRVVSSGPLPQSREEILQLVGK